LKDEQDYDNRARNEYPIGNLISRYRQPRMANHLMFVEIAFNISPKHPTTFTDANTEHEGTVSLQKYCFTSDIHWGAI
jgi:hypothetical protein